MRKHFALIVLLCSIAVTVAGLWAAQHKLDKESLTAVRSNMAEIEKQFLAERAPAEWWLNDKTTHQEVLRRARETWRNRQLEGEALSHIGWVRASFQKPDSSIAFNLGDPVDRNPWGTWDIRIAFYPGAEDSLVDCIPGSLNIPGFEMPPALLKAWLASQLVGEYRRCSAGIESDMVEVDAEVNGALAFAATCPALMDQVRIAASPTDLKCWFAGPLCLYSSNLERMEQALGAGHLNKEAAAYFCREMIFAVGATSVQNTAGSARQKRIWRHLLWECVTSGKWKRGQTTPTPRVTDAGCSAYRDNLHLRPLAGS